MLQREINGSKRLSIVILFSVFSIFQMGCKKSNVDDSIPNSFLLGTGLENKVVEVKRFGDWEAEFVLIAKGDSSPSVEEIKKIYSHRISDVKTLNLLKKRVRQICPDLHMEGDEIFLRGVPNSYLRFEVIVSKNASIFFGYR